MSAVEAYSRLAGVYDEIVVDPCFADWAVFLDDLWSEDPDPVRRVLDVCCGTGLIAAELIPKGYTVVGLDASEAMLDRARGLLGPDVELHRIVLPDLPLANVFDAAISTMDGLNYLSAADLRRTFAALAPRVRPGGWLVFDIHTDAMMEFTLEHPVVEGEEAGRAFVITSVIDPETRQLDSTIDLTGPTPDESFSEHHRQYFHTDEQVRSGLVDAGFTDITITDEYTGVPADARTLRATWIARRAGGQA